MSFLVLPLGCKTLWSGFWQLQPKFLLHSALTSWVYQTHIYSSLYPNSLYRTMVLVFWSVSGNFFFNHKSEITISLVGQNGNCPCLLISAVTERHVFQDSWDLRVKHYISLQLCPNDSLSGLVFLFCKMRIYYLLLLHIYQGRFLNVPCSWAASTTTRDCWFYICHQAVSKLCWN